MGWFSKKQTPNTDDLEVVTGEEKTDPKENTEQKTEAEVSSAELEKYRKEAEEAKREAERYKLEAEQFKKERNETVNKLSDETENRFKAEEVAIKNAITAFTSDADRIQKELVQAQEEGKFSEAAKLQRELSSAQFKIDEWSNKQANLETSKKPPKIETRPSQDDLIAAELEKYNQYPTVKEWLGENKKYFIDPKFRAKVDAVHYDAIDAGHAFGTQEYRDFVDGAIHKKEELKVDPKPEPKKSSTLPPSRGSSMSNNSGKETVKLSAQEVEYAQIANPQLYAKDPAKAVALYAAAQKKLIEEGKIRKWN